MILIQPNCRVQFTAEDLDFITRTLGRHANDHQVLLNLLADEETRDMILDDEQLYRALLEQRGCLRISNRLYFYVIVRNVLRNAGIDDRGVADYTAEMLSQYCVQDRTRCQVPGHDQPFDYFFEMLAALQNADDRNAFYIRAHIGNHSLFLSGVFPQRIRYRAEKKGFPSLGYYEALGQSSFKIASDHRLAERYDLAPIYATLADRFQETRQALNDMSERIVSLGDIETGIEKLLLTSLDQGWN